MSRPRFLTDHDLNEHIIDGLLRREPSIDIVRVRDVAMDARPDHEVLAFAHEQRRILISHDVNTMPYAAYSRLKQGSSVTGLLLARQRDPIAPVIESILLIWAGMELEEWDGQIWFLLV